MKVAEAMSRDVETVNPTDTLLEAAEKMRALNVGALPVVDEDEELVGVITDRDIVIRAVALNHGPDGTGVSDCMTHDPLWCYEDQELEQAARLMEEHQIRRLMV